MPSPLSSLSKGERRWKLRIATPVQELCKHLAPEIGAFIDYCRRLRFEEDPDYNYLRPWVGVSPTSLISSGISPPRNSENPREPPAGLWEALFGCVTGQWILCQPQSSGGSMANSPAFFFRFFFPVFFLAISIYGEVPGCSSSFRALETEPC